MSAVPTKTIVARSLLRGTEAVEADTGQSFPRHMHETFGIGLIRRGAQRSASGRGPVEAGAGDVITVNPGEIHDGLPIGDHGRAWHMLYLETDLVSEACRDVSDQKFSEAEFSDPVIRNTAIASDFARVYGIITGRLAAADETYIMAAEEWLLETCATLLLRRAATPGVPASVRHARALIDDDPAVAVSLADLAEASGLSRYQILRAFTQATGLTPHAYIIQRRLSMARRLIREGTPLAEAAATSGFSDQSHMTRLFARFFGFSPGALAASL
ncbi:AraC family transcriptional regulator [Pararhizobium arenae]|uniref:AraC family transcriptional regulator n=1 Tax=Pararhizobium arenae TaxID=1856850 RepID=UPI00094AE304|nr:AraC family transcriptional regulator [Pararhizobium arenae]